MRPDLNKFGLVLVISLTVRGLYLFQFGDCASFDLGCWNKVADVLQAGGNPYHDTRFLNYPPLWMQLLFLFKKLSLAWQVSFNTVVRGFLIAVESALSLLLYTTLARVVKAGGAAQWLLAGIALNPVAIYQVCQHGNFDVLVGFWGLLAVSLVLRFQEAWAARFWLLACLALGLGALTKIVPLCLAPLLWLGWRRLHALELLLGAVLLLGPITLGLSVIYVLGPEDIQSKVLGYRSVAGDFGFTGLFAGLGLSAWLAAWPRVFILGYGSAWLAVCLWLGQRDTLNPRQVVSLAVVLLMAIPALGPGYGPQYVYWFLPLLVLLYGLGTRGTRRFLGLLYGVAVATYTIEYGLNFKTYGAFWLDITQTRSLLQLGLALATPAAQTWLNLPLWLLYCAGVAGWGTELARELFRDLRTGWRGAARSNPPD